MVIASEAISAAQIRTMRLIAVFLPIAARYCGQVPGGGFCSKTSTAARRLPIWLGRAGAAVLVLARIASTPQGRLNELLPWEWKNTPVQSAA